jgi:hypothetical protein
VFDFVIVCLSVFTPEVGNEKPYNEKCDVYSFAILFWEMYSLKKAFEVYTVKSFKSRVWDPNGECKRPFVQESWPVPIKSLLVRSWSKNIEERPTFQNITELIRCECVRVRGGNEDGLDHVRRRSSFVYNNKRKPSRLLDKISSSISLDDKARGG